MLDHERRRLAPSESENIAWSRGNRDLCRLFISLAGIACARNAQHGLSPTYRAPRAPSHRRPAQRKCNEMRNKLLRWHSSTPLMRSGTRVASAGICSPSPGMAAWPHGGCESGELCAARKNKAAVTVAPKLASSGKHTYSRDGE